MLATALVTVGSNLIGGGYNYRETVSPWCRSLFTLNPHPVLMVGAPLNFQVHVLVVRVLLGIWPYTRLVHVFSAPLGYLVRPRLPQPRPAAPRLVPLGTGLGGALSLAVAGAASRPRSPRRAILLR